MKSTRSKSSRRSAKTADISDKKQGAGLSPSKRHREKLNNVMDELSDLLPLSRDVKTSLDRLSILKLTVSFFQTQNLMKSAGKSKQLQCVSKKENDFISEEINLSEMALEAIGGFFIVLTEDGNVYYVSENVKNYLGYPQTRLMHQEFFPHIHPDDLQGLQSCFLGQPSKIKSNSEIEDLDLTLSDSRQECYCNVRCHAGRLSSHVSPFYYKCFRFYGHVKVVKRSEKTGKQYGFFALCSPVMKIVNVSRPIKEHALKYTCKMDAAMSNLQVDSRGLKTLRFSEQDLIGKSAYFFFHPDDLEVMALVHERLIKDFKATITFRIVKGNGKWQWVRGRAYTLINRGKIDGMVANNVFVSDEEGIYYKAQNIKELQEWKAQQNKSITSSQSSASSSCSSPDNSSSWNSGTDTSFYSISSSSSALNDLTLTQNPSVGKPPKRLTSPEEVREQYQETPSSVAVSAVTTKVETFPIDFHDRLTSPFFDNAVATKSDVSSQAGAECLPVSMGNEMMLAIIKELQSSAIDDVTGTSVLPSPLSSQWNTDNSNIQGQPLVPAGCQDIVQSEGASVRMNTGLPVTSGPVFYFGGGLVAGAVDETSIRQDGQPVESKNMNANPSNLQLDLTNNNTVVDENKECHLSLNGFGSSTDTLNEDSFKDFTMLPLGEIESILLSNDSSSSSLTPQNVPQLSRDPPIIEHVFMDSHCTLHSQSYDRRLEARNTRIHSALFQNELSLYESQSNQSQVKAKTTDLGTSTYTETKGNALASQVHHRFTGNGAYL